MNDRLDAEETIRVAIADDQRLFAHGLARIIGVQPGMEVVGEAHTGGVHPSRPVQALTPPAGRRKQTARKTDEQTALLAASSPSTTG